jgi:hypothetical protein
MILRGDHHIEERRIKMIVINTVNRLLRMPRPIHISMHALCTVILFSEVLNAIEVVVSKGVSNVFH